MIAVGNTCARGGDLQLAQHGISIFFSSNFFQYGINVLALSKGGLRAYKKIKERYDYS